MSIKIHDDLAGLEIKEAFARNFLHVLLSQPIDSLIHNVHTTLKVVEVDEHVLPLTVSDYHPDNSYVCSTFNHYFVYGLEELNLLDKPLLVKLLHGLIAPIKALYQHNDFDKVVMVNNWLLSTNLWQSLTQVQIQSLLDFLKQHFPEYAIVFRSVDACSNPDLYQSLLDADCKMLFSRKVYFQNIAEAYRKRDFKQDLRLYHETDYELVTGDALEEKDFVRIQELYNMLYLERYSLQNPQFSREYMLKMWQCGAMQFRVFRKQGRIDAAMSYYMRRGIMTQPIFGYDTTLPQKLGLYRLLSTQVVLEGQAHQYQIHNSAGVGHFKRLRGATPVTEYNAVYLDALPVGKRLLWQALIKLMNGLVVPLIDKYGF